MNEKTPNKAVSSADLQEDNTIDTTRGLEETVKRLTEENEKLNLSVTSLDDKNKRLAAELHNLGARLRREAETKLEYAISHFAKEILDIGDILVTGLDNCEDKKGEHYQGMEMTLSKFYDILKQHGITPLDSMHQIFNHDLHEALTSQETSELEPGHILQVIQEGYKFKDRLLRPAKVLVSKKVSEDS